MLEDFFFDLFRTRIPLPEIIGRLSLAVVFGAAIGIDREFRQKAAGLRTHILVALAAAMFTVIAFEIFFEVQEITDNSRSDVIRVIEAVTAGVAFLAAGTLIQSRGSVQGLTTGASLWMACAVGLAFGGCFYSIELTGTVLALLVLILLGHLEASLSGASDKT